MTTIGCNLYPRIGLFIHAYNTRCQILSPAYNCSPVESIQELYEQSRAKALNSCALRCTLSFSKTVIYNEAQPSITVPLYVSSGVPFRFPFYNFITKILPAHKKRDQMYHFSRCGAMVSLQPSQNSPVPTPPLPPRPSRSTRSSSRYARPAWPSPARRLSR